MKNSMAILLSFVAGAMSALCVSPFFRHDTVNAKMPKVSSSEAMRPESEDAARDLNQKVRQNLLSIVARNLGVEKESAKDVVKVIVEIIKMTE